MKNIFKILLFFIILLNGFGSTAQESKLEELYKKCKLILKVTCELNDNNNWADISALIKDSTAYSKEYKLRNNESYTIEIPFGKIYDFKISSQGYASKWIVINLRDSLEEADYTKDTFPFVALFSLKRTSDLPEVYKEQMELKVPLASILYNKKSRMIDYNEAYTKAIIDKLRKTEKKATLLIQNPELKDDFNVLNDSVKASQLILTKKNEELLKERLALLEKQSANEKLEKEKLLREVQLARERAISISKQKELDLANQLRIYQQQKAEGLEVIRKIEQQQFLNQKKLNESEIKEQKALAISKQKELELAQQEKKTKELEAKNATFLRNTFIGLAILVGLISLLLFRAYFIKRNSNTKLQKQNELIAHQKQEITDSIQYAQRIQFAILPTKEAIAKAFPQSFVLFKPKDIVSGDFYWFQQVQFGNESVSQFDKEESAKKGELSNRQINQLSNQKLFLAACDCTGHGVPGALMSMVATDMLNDSLLHTKEVNKILEQTNRSIKIALKQTTEDDSTRDGMDLAMISLDYKNLTLEYAGAYRPLWIIRANNHQSPIANYQLIEYKATKAAIGGLTEDNQEFQKHTIQLQKGDTIYMSTDGFADQFSPADKKLMTKRFKEILLSIQHLTMPEQEQYLDKFITDWRGNMEQTDDVLVIGVRV